MLREIADLGFGQVELSHGIRVTLAPGILRALEDGVIKVSSTHNFCPLPAGIMHAAPNLFEPSARQAAEFGQWVRQTRRSIEFAAQVQSSVLVCHLGRVRYFWLNPTRAVRRYLADHPDAGRRPDDLEYAALRDKCLAKVRRKAPPFLEQVRASVGEVLDLAREKGVRLGFENREKIDELPLDADMAELIESFGPDAPVGYWHDTGHADLKEGMGLLNHREHLESLAPRLLGFHLHDVSAKGHDHQPVGAGHIDFKMVSRFWRPEHRLTLELSPRATVEDIIASKARIEALLA
jgi:sugar phosphate isomerase/epimerase